MEKKATGELDWDITMAEGSKHSWKDEWLVILFSVPLILAFIPGMEGVVEQGFAQLNRCPIGINTAWASSLPHLLGCDLQPSSSRRNNANADVGHAQPDHAGTSKEKP